ncbi:MAG: N-acetylmuramoyl-L-alanine amidase [Duncaniella sp.]|nr:N-acetylmuramoyl-L-alanine amidase [Duncaniella sp.]
MRKINKIIIHSTATPAGRHVSVAEINAWHLAKGYDGIGYHFVVLLDGTVCPGRPVEKVGAHCYGHNSDSVGVVYVGGVAPDGKTPLDTRTPAQKQALRLTVSDLKSRFPAARVYAHRDLRPTACPSFDISDL